MPDQTIALLCPYGCNDYTDTDEECPHLGFPYSELFILDGSKHPSGQCGFACSVCGVDVDGVPCPDHAPAEAPGLRLVECEATPRHVMFVHDRDDYGVPCPWCILDSYYEKARLARQCQHWGWRRWRLVGKVDRYLLGPLRITLGHSWKLGDGCDGCETLFWRWSGRRSK
jgi:hypothetical protein